MEGREGDTEIKGDGGGKGEERKKGERRKWGVGDGTASSLRGRRRGMDAPAETFIAPRDLGTEITNATYHP